MKTLFSLGNTQFEENKNIFLFILILTMTGCLHSQETLTWVEEISDIRNRYPDVKQIQTAELQSWLTNTDKEPVILIDARHRKEFSVSHISGAKHIPHNSKNLLNHLTDIKPDRQQFIRFTLIMPVGEAYLKRNTVKKSSDYSAFDFLMSLVINSSAAYGPQVPAR